MSEIVIQWNEYKIGPKWISKDNKKNRWGFFVCSFLFLVLGAKAVIVFIMCESRIWDRTCHLPRRRWSQIFKWEFFCLTIVDRYLFIHYIIIYTCANNDVRCQCLILYIYKRNVCAFNFCICWYGFCSHNWQLAILQFSLTSHLDTYVCLCVLRIEIIRYGFQKSGITLFLNIIYYILMLSCKKLNFFFILLII